MNRWLFAKEIVSLVMPLQQDFYENSIGAPVLNWKTRKNNHNG
jgi:hypothetical protein